MIVVEMHYTHTEIRNWSWQRRREQEMLRIVSNAIHFTFMPHPWPNTEMAITCAIGFSCSRIQILLDGIDEKKARTLLNYLNNNKNVCARLHTNPEPATIPA